jgi:uncharacterized membrane protein (DUF106 family)
LNQTLTATQKSTIPHSIPLSTPAFYIFAFLAGCFIAIPFAFIVKRHIDHRHIEKKIRARNGLMREMNKSFMRINDLSRKRDESMRETNKLRMEANELFMQTSELLMEAELIDGNPYYCFGGDG